VIIIRVKEVFDGRGHSAHGTALITLDAVANRLEIDLETISITSAFAVDTNATVVPRREYVTDPEIKGVEITG